MKFFFPDSQDQVDPSFDFETEQRSPHRVRQRDDLYCHETLGVPPYGGMLVSKSIVDGRAEGTARYTIAQRARLYREGVRSFLRLDGIAGPRIETIGDCGAFTYVRNDVPPYSVDEVIDFYENGFDFGVSVDHVILDFDESLDGNEAAVPEAWATRQQLTLDLAADFLERSGARKCRFQPMGVAQGWSPLSYARAVKCLQQIGYDRIAIGGMVPLRTPEILKSLAAIATVRESKTQLHLLGVTRCAHVGDFAGFGVTSFDSTSPFRQAFKDMTDNYYTLDRTYVALRVPQVDGNATLKRRILAGEVSQSAAMRLESACLTTLAEFDKGQASRNQSLEVLMEYELLVDGKESHRIVYDEALNDRPWRACNCSICRSVGIHVMLFRGSERNKRRGFHNVYVFNNRLQDRIDEVAAQ